MENMVLITMIPILMYTKDSYLVSTIMDISLTVNELVEHVKKNVGDGRAIALVSGGVDSATSAVIAYKALKEKVIPVFIDTGFMRLDEPVEVKKALSSIMDVKIYDYSEMFYQALDGKCEAEEKRKVFRDVFYNVVAEIAEKEGAKYIVQGTIASDVIETVGGIKTQHNVLEDIGHNPFADKGFKVVEPLKEYYKDEVREIALYLGIPETIVYRQPFPGPGLLVRLVGCFRREYLDVLKHANKIVEENLKDQGFSQYFAAVWKARKHPLSFDGNNLILGYEDVKATGVKGDARQYGRILVIESSGPVIDIETFIGLSQRTIWKYSEASRIVFMVKKTPHTSGLTVSIRAVVTEDFMTADVPRISRELLEKIADAILQLKGVSEVVYDITPKPPGTIEYE